MVISYVLDASVAIKWFSKEKEQNLLQAQKLLQDIEEKKVDVFTPDFFLVEMANAFIFGKKLATAQVYQAIQTILDSKIDIVPLSTKIIFLAIELSKKYNLTIYDCLYLALAQSMNCKVLTADKLLLNTVKSNTFDLSQYK